MNNNEEIRRANRKALPKFLLIMVLSLVVGGIIGFAGVMALIAAGEDNVTGALAAFASGFARNGAPVLLGITVAAELLTGLFFKARASAVIRDWDGEDEAVSDRADRLLSVGLWIDNLCYILSLFLFGAFYSCGLSSARDPVRFFGTLVLFLASFVLSIGFTRRFVDLTKRLYPEKKASVFDIKFQKEWFSQCDEAERALVGQCAYRAYTAMQKVCVILWLAFTMAALFLDTGFLPILAVCLIWAATSSVYAFESIRLGGPGRPRAHEE